MNRLDVGDSVRLVATFKDFEGVARDPATVVLRVRKPSGDVLQPAVLHPRRPGSRNRHSGPRCRTVVRLTPRLSNPLDKQRPGSVAWDRDNRDV
jgi:hypothetical protein